MSCNGNSKGDNILAILLKILKFIHLGSLSVWIGSIVFLSFAAAPAIFKNFERAEAGKIIGYIFPKYWMVGYISSSLILASLIGIGVVTKTMPVYAVGVATVMTATAFYSGLVVGSEAREIKARMYAEEDPTKKAELRKEFGASHKKSGILNMLILLMAIALLVMASMRLKY